MAVSIPGHLHVGVPKPARYLLNVYSLVDKQGSVSVPVWYNKDKRYKTLLQKGLGAFADIFQFFFHLEKSGKIHLQKMGVFH